MITLRARVDAVGRALVAGNGRTSDQPLARVPVSARVAAYGAAAWAVGFAGVNIYLQIVGIDSGQIQRNWTAFTIANLGVVVLKLVGAAVALATVQPWGRRLPAPLLTVSAWGAAGRAPAVRHRRAAVSGCGRRPDHLRSGRWHIPSSSLGVPGILRAGRAAVRSDRLAAPAADGDLVALDGRWTARCTAPPRRRPVRVVSGVLTRSLHWHAQESCGIAHGVRLSVE
jgi:hypothetical protein